MLYPEFKVLNLPEIDKQILEFWEKEQVFRRSMEERDASNSYVFYEGPPSANGMPGIHHVMARAVKDIFCRFHTMKGQRVDRKGGWDTHGLPIELSVEKELGITKEDIGTKISVDEYNAKCRETVMRFKDKWDEVTLKMGYWVDLQNPYITFTNDYIESVWWLLKQMYNKDMLYKGYTIQPYSPAAGTGLSSHELNMPGCYREITDTTIVAQFKAKNETLKPFLQGFGDIHFLAWTTTPWTLPSNTALTVGPKIDYVLVESYNQYTFQPIKVILAKNLVGSLFSGKFFEATEEEIKNYTSADKKIPYRVLLECKGADLEGMYYEQLLPYTLPYQTPENAFRVILGDFVTTEDGTGIVHTAPTFGADDMRAAKEANPPVPPMLILDENDNPVPLVDLQGKFVAEMGEFGGRYVKNEYYNTGEAPDKSVDVEIAIKLKEENKAFKVEKYAHNYPHCWRTDKPVLYYPLDSWFIRASAMKERMSALNKTINWKPEATGTGRFGNWLDNLQDWNLSRSRYWGIPLPIWVTEDKAEKKCIGSVAELQEEVDKANKALGLQQVIPNDLHRPYIDSVILVSSENQPMKRELDLIDVWFDSGAMPFAQWHFPFENIEKFAQNYPADFIAEGVDQTRGWFYTLHAISSIVKEEVQAELSRHGIKVSDERYPGVAFKNVVSNGLVLDKNGQKMSKRLGNAVDPFETLPKYGADATRWYMISNSQPWDNLKFDADGILETRNKLFGTLFNTYNFFAIYANVDGFKIDEHDITPITERPELDQWILSKLHSLVKTVTEKYEQYEPTDAARAVENFVDEHLSNWYVRLSRRRFWKGEMNADKKAAYETLFECLMVTTQLMAPIAPFFTDWIYQNLSNPIRENAIKNQTPLRHISVHLSLMTSTESNVINLDLEQKMEYAQRISSLVLSLRKKEKIKVRQPLQKVLLPILDINFQTQVEAVKALVLAETNIKQIEYVTDTSGLISKKAKPNFKTLGRLLGKNMKDGAAMIENFDSATIQQLEKENSLEFVVNGEQYNLTKEDVVILSEDIPGWQVASDGAITVALDTHISDELAAEGMARELVNRIQNIRKSKDFNITDKIIVNLSDIPEIKPAIDLFKEYISKEVLAEDISLTTNLQNGETVELDENLELLIDVKKA